MDIPSCFNTLARAFNQDFIVNYKHKTREEMLADVILIVPPRDRIELAEYIDRLVRAGPEVCRTVWNGSAADIFLPRDEDLLRLLGDIRMRL